MAQSIYTGLGLGTYLGPTGNCMLPRKHRTAPDPWPIIPGTMLRARRVPQEYDVVGVRKCFYGDTGLRVFFFVFTYRRGGGKVAK